MNHEKNNDDTNNNKKNKRSSIMSIAGPQDHRGHLPGGRSRNMRTLIIAGFLLILIWTIKKSPMFQAHVSLPFLSSCPRHVLIFENAALTAPPPTQV